MNVDETLSNLLPYIAYFLAATPPVLFAKHLFAYLSDRHRRSSKLEFLSRSIEGTEPGSRAEILRALGETRRDDPT
jgi:hypothetical protein